MENKTSETNATTNMLDNVSKRGPRCLALQLSHKFYCFEFSLIVMIKYVMLICIYICIYIYISETVHE